MKLINVWLVDVMKNVKLDSTFLWNLSRVSLDSSESAIIGSFAGHERLMVAFEHLILNKDNVFGIDPLADNRVPHNQIISLFRFRAANYLGNLLSGGLAKNRLQIKNLLPYIQSADEYLTEVRLLLTVRLSDDRRNFAFLHSFEICRSKTTV